MVQRETVTRDKYTSTYKAYNLSSVIYAFKQVTGVEPTKIKVKCKDQLLKEFFGWCRKFNVE